MTPEFTWTKPRRVLLEKRWASGVEASDIANELGVTRNAVIGKAHRMGLTRRRPGWRKEQRLRRGYTNKPRVFTRVIGGGKIPELNTPAPAGERAPVSMQVPILAAEPHHCREITGRGDDGLATICGHQVVYRSCCVFHARMTYKPESIRISSLEAAA